MNEPGMTKEQVHKPNEAKFTNQTLLNIIVYIMQLLHSN